jgi:hypothetical protein
MCPFPNESLHDITDENLINQFENSFHGDINDYEMITLFCNGNYFNDVEISKNVRNYIFKRIAESNAKYAVVESLPQFITSEKLDEIKTILGDKKLVVVMGFQSADDTVRNLAVNTTCTKTSFEFVVSEMLKREYIPMAFLMIKPPFLTESEAVSDVVESAKYLASIGMKQVTLCPMRVAPNTVASILYNMGGYKSLWIWSVVDILKRIHNEVPGITAVVNTTELKQDLNEDSTCAVTCPKCKDVMIKQIEKYLYTRDLNLLNLGCDCRKDYESFRDSEIDTRSVEMRVSDFLQNLP